MVSDSPPQVVGQRAQSCRAEASGPDIQLDADENLVCVNKSHRAWCERKLAFQWRFDFSCERETEIRDGNGSEFGHAKWASPIKCH